MNGSIMEKRYILSQRFAKNRDEEAGLINNEMPRAFLFLEFEDTKKPQYQTHPEKGESRNPRDRIRARLTHAILRLYFARDTAYHSLLRQREGVFFAAFQERIRADALSTRRILRSFALLPYSNRD